MFKKIIIPVVSLVCCSYAQTDVVWETNYQQAVERAEKENKLIMMEFTGSDWCPPCMMLKEQVLGKKQFIEKVKDKIVLLELDFPQNKEQSEELKKQNNELAEKHTVKAFPSIIFINPKGEVVKRFLGSVDMGQMLKHIDEALEKAKELNKAAVKE